MSEDPHDAELWHEIFEHFGGEGSADAEFLHVAALMAELFPWMLGDEAVWERTAGTDENAVSSTQAGRLLA